MRGRGLRALALAAVIALSPSVGLAQSASSRSTTQATLNSSITTNGIGCITGAVLNSVLTGITNSVLFGASDLASGVLTALGIAPGITGSFVEQSGSIPTNNCLKWGPGVKDAGACASAPASVYYPLSTLAGGP